MLLNIRYLCVAIIKINEIDKITFKSVPQKFNFNIIFVENITIMWVIIVITTS